MVAPQRRTQAGAMNTTAPNPEHSIDDEQAGTEPGTANGTSAGPQGGPGCTQGPSDLFGNLNELRRPVQGRLLGGVAAGIARYLGADVNLVRIGFVLLAFLGGAAVPVYIVAWLLIPEDGAAQSIAGELFSSFENRSR
jgi:phage shock protein PspC (stress-responsive transcriptional regulator)